MKVCLYIRLSSADKDIRFKSESESIANQRALLRQYLRDHREFSSYEPIEFIDDGFSGTNGDRPGFEKMIAFLRDGGSKLVLCKDLSRFFRDYVEIGDYLERIFPFLGVRLIAVNDGYDSNDYKGTTGGMDVVMKCIVYSFYSRDLSQKVQSVLRAKQKKGQFVGAYAPYGFLKDPEDKHHLIHDPTATPVVQRIFEMAASGKSTGDIAKALNDDHVEPPANHFFRLYPDSKKFRDKTSKENCWTCLSVAEIIKRKEYYGALTAQKRQYKNLDHPVSSKKDESEWIIVPNCHEPVVSEELFNKAQRAIHKKPKYERDAKEYLLRSLLHCGTCGRALARSRSGPKTRTFYKCDSSRYKKDTPCPNGEHFYEDDLEKAVLASLTKLFEAAIDEDNRLKELSAKTKGSTENLRRSIIKLEQTIKRDSTEKLTAYEKYSDGEISREAFMEIRDRITKDIETNQKDKATLEGQLAALEQAPEVTEVQEIANIGRDYFFTGQISNQTMLSLIERVNVYHGMKIEIVYRFQNPLTANTKSGKI